MSCAEIRDRLHERMYGLLDGSDAEEMDRHVAACAECAAELEDARGRDQLLDLWKPAYAARGPVRLRPRRLPAWMAAAAGLLVALGAGLFPLSTPYDVAPGQASTATVVRLGAAGRLELESGARILLREGGEGRDHEVELAAGTARVEVFPTGRAFRVIAGDVKVEVRGTRFLVSRLEDGAMNGWKTGTPLALVAVAAGTVLLTSPHGAATLEAGRAAIVTPEGIERIEGGTSLEAARKVRDELARALAAREVKNRGLREEVEALRGKHGPVELPPGATLRSLVDALAEAVRGADRKAIERAMATLHLFVGKEEGAFEALLAEIGAAKDVRLAAALCDALWVEEGTRILRHKRAVLKLMLSPGLSGDLRDLLVAQVSPFLGWKGTLTGVELSDILRTARAIPGTGEETTRSRALLAEMAARQMSPEAWGDFERFLDAEADADLRKRAIGAYLDAGRGRERSAAHAEALLCDALRGRYGASAAADRLSRPLASWFRPENGAAFAGVLRQAASVHPEASGRQAAAGQLATLYLLQKTPEALEAFRQVQGAEADPGARSRMGDVLRALEKGDLDLDGLMQKLQLEWTF